LLKDNQTALRFRENAAKAVGNQSLRLALRKATDLLSSKRQQGIVLLPMTSWRDIASEIRLKVLEDLHTYVDTFAFNATKSGAVVYRARDAQTANEIVGNILRDRNATKIVKSKSMVTEEIHLNEYLESRGIEVVETDLGEYIVQLAGETPSHILGPAIHKTRQQVGRLFSEKLGVAYSDDPEVLTKIARKRLRNKFLCAHAGISGANFAIADSGSLVLFTNEGNGRMVTTLPPIHVAVLSIEKIIPSIHDLPIFAQILTRSATGQPLSSYMSVITGTRKPGETTGARELHIVLLDNGRSEIVAGDQREILKCIRCSACINVCPVYRSVGGHAYCSPYSGPMGVILTVLLTGMKRAHTLLEASTLCGACDEVCPVKVPLKRLIQELRKERANQRLTAMSERTAMNAFAITTAVPTLFGIGQKLSCFSWSFLNRITGRNVLDRLPKPADTAFRRRIS
jgi:L-lactate dehydrogenase complex protein LldF